MPRSKTSLFIAPFMMFSAAILSTVATGEDTVATEDVSREARIRELVSQLGSDDFAARESATQSLLEAGPAAFQAVKSAQSNKDPEIRNRAKLLHAQIVETAVKHLEQLGATFTGGKRHSPNWLAARKCKLSDSDLAHVGCLNSLTRVYFYQNPFTDKGMKHLQALQRLEVLSLRGCRHITDEGMKHLRGMTQLRELTLDGRDISDRTLAVVSTCPKLERLAIFSEAISDDGLTHLAALKRLNWILFHGCKVSGAGLAKLKPLSTELRSLRFYNVALNDADLKAEVVPNSRTTGGRKQERGPGRRCVRVRCECAGCR